MCPVTGHRAVDAFSSTSTDALTVELYGAAQRVPRSR